METLALAPEVTILMAAYNAEKTIERALQSILSQKLRSFCFIVVDDGSHDGTPKILAEMAVKDSRLHILTLPQNQGLTRALNQGLTLVKTPYLARMDADDHSRPNRLERQLAAMKANPSWIACGSDVQVVSEKGDLIKHVTRPKSSFVLALRKKNVFVHGSLMFETDVLRSAGGYDDYFRLAQDYDLLLRLSRMGELGWIDETLYELTWRDQSLTSSQMGRQIHFAAVAITRFLTTGKAAGDYQKSWLSFGLYRLERLRLWIWIYKCGFSFRKPLR